MSETPFDNITPEKAEFIQQAAKEAGNKSQAELLSYLMGINRQASGKNMEFTDAETDLLVRQLTAGLSPKERKKVELLRRLSRMISQPRKKEP